MRPPSRLQRVVEELAVWLLLSGLVLIAVKLWETRPR